MCIVCEIKTALENEAPSKEGRKFITQRVEMLAAVASNCHDVVCDVLEGKPQSRVKLEEMRVLGGVIFSDAPDAMERREAMLAEANAREEVVSAFDEALAELFGAKGVSVKVMQVSGDDLPEALREILQDSEPTKH